MEEKKLERLHEVTRRSIRKALTHDATLPIKILCHTLFSSLDRPIMMISTGCWAYTSSETPFPRLLLQPTACFLTIRRTS